jgi:hypothetical protein
VHCGNSCFDFYDGGIKMNERIEKLAEQADLLGDFTPTKIPGRYVGYITEEHILKFAELIVGECASICYKSFENGDMIAGLLMQTFGVEEK